MMDMEENLPWFRRNLTCDNELVMTHGPGSM